MRRVAAALALAALALAALAPAACKRTPPTDRAPAGKP